MIYNQGIENNRLTRIIPPQKVPSIWNVAAPTHHPWTGVFSTRGPVKLIVISSQMLLWLRTVNPRRVMQ